ncbi:MAG: histidine kinase [Lachnospiraceae bacterium]|nr:histidine kinase [Lachnospiraceae bacterium]
MNKDKISVLQEIYDKCLRDRIDTKENIQKMTDRLSEIELHLNSIQQDDEFDLKVFSPRKSKDLSIEKERISQLENEKYELENSKRKQEAELSKLDTQIEQLEQLIKNFNDTRFKIIDVQEKERQRISRDLHDSTVQNLTHLIHRIELSSMFIDQDKVRAKLELESCIKILKTSIEEIRETIFNLRPMTFDDLGFRQCVENLIANMKLNYRNCDVELNVFELDQYEWKIKNKKSINLFLVTVYRIIQEAISNIIKHSEADKISLDIKCVDTNCVLIIKDNGKGFSVEDTLDQNEKHFGLSDMQDRVNLLNGNINIISECGHGTELKIEIPLI